MTLQQFWEAGHPAVRKILQSKELTPGVFRDELLKEDPAREMCCESAWPAVRKVVQKSLLELRVPA